MILSMRSIRPLLLLLFLAFPAALAGEAADAQRDVWSGMAGMDEELRGQTLELRDELIASHLSYLAALEKALAQVEAMPESAPEYALAWVRVEYLLETGYRLLDFSGEYDAFLKVTEPLKPERRAAPPLLELAATAADDATDGGLLYFDAENRPLELVSSGTRVVLVDAETRTPPLSQDGIVARARSPRARTEKTFIPMIRARAAWLRALALERLGKTREAAVEAEGLGLIRDWVVLGPLEGLAEDFSSVNYGLEDFYAGLDAKNSRPGKNGPVFWKPFSSLDPLGRVFPGAIFRGDGLKSAYALALIHADADGEAVVRFGSSASAVVGVNHRIADRIRYAGPPDPDEEAFAVWLRRGWNAVLVRTSSEDEDWTFALRLTLPDGTPFPGRAAKPDRENLGLFFDEARKAARRSFAERFYTPDNPVEGGGGTVLSAWLEDHRDDARGNFYLASFLVAKRMMEGPDRFDREMIFRRAVELSGGDPFFTLMSARSVDADIEGPDREENLRLVLLKDVADQGSAAALADIGRLYLDVMRQPRRADEYADMALSVNPMSLRAGVLDYDVAVAMDWQPVARQLLDRLVKRHPSAPAARLRFGRAALSEGRHRQALGEFHAILGVQAGNREALDGAVSALGMLGQTSAAVELLVSHIERFPYDFGVRLKLAELYRSLGRDADARGVINAALELGPDDPSALAMRRELDSETYAEGKAASGETLPPPRQELDLSPPRVQPANGWEYLYFQVEDRMEAGGVINRNVAFALRIYTERAARTLRHLDLLTDGDFERSVVTRLEVIQADGTRQPYTQPLPGEWKGGAAELHMPPLQPGMTIEAEVRIRRDRIPFLGDYFGHTASLAQQAPVRLSRYMFTAPKEQRVHFKAINGAPEAMVVESADGRFVTRIWEMTGLSAFIAEPYSSGQFGGAPCVQVSSFRDWDEFARWYWRLIGVQYHSPPELRYLASRLGANSGAPLGKLDAAAAWVTQTIGARPWEYGPYAFRPINARSILSRLSADSKDRTLLLCLFAREYGLDAWPVLTRLRNGLTWLPPMTDSSLPLLDHFNYSITLVRSSPGGDVFLDAANPYRPPGVIPSRLFGAAGVAITPGGAQRVAIPDGGAAACEWNERAELIVDEDGSIVWQEELAAVGTAAEMLRRHFRSQDEAEAVWTDFLISMGGDPSVASGEFHDGDIQPARADWIGRARLRRHAVSQDERVVLDVPDLPAPVLPSALRVTYPLGLEVFTREGGRSQDLLLPHGFKVARRISVRFPHGWRLINPGQSFARTYPFGTLSLECALEPDGMLVDFVVEVPGHVVKAEDFDAFREMAALARRWIRPQLVWEKP